MRRTLVLTILTLLTASFTALPTATAHGDTVSVATCGGLAPMETFCETGGHTDNGFVNQQCVGTAGYTGTIQSRVTYSDGTTVTLKCHYENGELIDSQTTGDYHSFSGVPYSHRCWSYDLHTTTEGGFGIWGCALIHR